MQGVQTMTSVTFASVQQAIIAEYEWTQRPSSNITTKISAVKRKGKSPQLLSCKTLIRKGLFGLILITRLLASAYVLRLLTMHSASI